MSLAIAGLVMVFARLCVQPAFADPPDVVVTLKPVHALVAAVMDGAGVPHLLIDGAASPHTYAMRPSDARRLSGADVIVRVSETLELFLVKPLATSGRRARVVTLDRIPGVTIYPVRSGDEYEAHEHGHPGSKGHGHSHGHSHAAAGKPGRHGQGKNAAMVATDGHIWLDPANARAIAIHMAEVLAEVAPAEAERYARNARSLVQRLDELDKRLAARLDPLAAHRYLVFHDAYQYLERRYRLGGIGSVTVNPEVPPSARRLSSIRARLASAKVVCVFSEPQFAPKAIDSIIEGTGIRKGVLDPLGSASKPGPDLYFELMEGLARDLEGCLAGRT
jgi:zinc transport system substrate-binding protein